MRKCTNIEYVSLQVELSNLVAQRLNVKKQSSSLRVREHRLRKIIKLIEEEREDEIKRQLQEQKSHEKSQIQTEEEKKQ